MRLLNQTRIPQPTKEFNYLRFKLCIGFILAWTIGIEVIKLIVSYAAGETSTSSDSDRVLFFGNVELGADRKDALKESLGEVMVRKGYASVVRHRSDEERSHIYEKLVEAEEAAKQERLGIHSGKEHTVSRQNDLAVPGR